MSEGKWRTTGQSLLFATLPNQYRSLNSKQATLTVDDPLLLKPVVVVMAVVEIVVIRAALHQQATP